MLGDWSSYLGKDFVKRQTEVCIPALKLISCKWLFLFEHQSPSL